MTTARLDRLAVSAALAVAAAAPPRRGHPGPREEKSGEKNRGGDITSMRLRRSLFFVASATPAGRPCGASPARPSRPSPADPAGPAAVCPAPPNCQGCRARGAFVLSNQAAQDARALRADELRSRRRDGASWSQIRCLHGRSVRRWCARVAEPKTAARTAAPACLSGRQGRQAAKSLLPGPDFPEFPGSFLLLACSRLRGIARYCAAKNIVPEQVSAHRQPFSVGLTTSVVSRSSRRLRAPSVAANAK